MTSNERKSNKNGQKSEKIGNKTIKGFNSQLDKKWNNQNGHFDFVIDSKFEHIIDTNQTQDEIRSSRKTKLDYEIGHCI